MLDFLGNQSVLRIVIAGLFACLSIGCGEHFSKKTKGKIKDEINQVQPEEEPDSPASLESNDESDENPQAVLAEDLGLSFQYPKNEKVTHEIARLENRQLHNLYVLEENVEPVEIFVYKETCQVEGRSRRDFSRSLKSRFEEILRSAVDDNGVITIPSQIDYAINKIPRTSGVNIVGFYADWYRTYHRNRIERMIILADRNQPGSCIFIKANISGALKITKDSLAGQTLISIQETLKISN